MLSNVMLNLLIDLPDVSYCIFFRRRISIWHFFPHNSYIQQRTHPGHIKNMQNSTLKDSIPNMKIDNKFEQVLFFFSGTSLKRISKQSINVQKMFNLTSDQGNAN